MIEADQVFRTLKAAGQDHLVAHAATLAQDDRVRFLESIEAMEPEGFAALIEQYVRSYIPESPPSSLNPAPMVPLDDPNREPAKHTGEALIRAGKVACFTVAGGQGSRLGYDGPKGCFQTSCALHKPLFQIFAEGIAGAQNRYRVKIPWYIMTSPLNHDATVRFFKERDHFGLDASAVMFFPQGVMPSFSQETGRMLLAAPGVLATNPDGHGGAFRALSVSGALADMKRRGIEHLSYFQVDNPLSRPVDPVFLGLHASAPGSSAQFSSKAVRKTNWSEKVGVFCLVDGRTQVIEYSDLPEQLAQEVDSDGGLRFNAGSVAIHAIGVDFIEKIASDPSFALPFHRAIKKVAFVDPQTGARTEPAEPNAIKLERFVFDGIPLADGSIVVEADRIEEFAPVKNATGTDSIESSRVLQTVRAARWLEAAGVSVPRREDGSIDAVIEISPLTAQDGSQLAEQSDLPEAIEPGSTVVL